MITVRKAHERGHFEFGWLKTYHTFSFGDYYDAHHMGFRTLRVINEDFVQAGEGFGTHPHKDMEIVTYVLAGELSHRDSMGNGSIIRANDVQYMSAGSGVTHSEFNSSRKDTTHLYQIWILPQSKGEQPRYDQKAIDPKTKRGRLKLLVSGTGEEDSIQIRQDAKLFASVLKPGESADFKLRPNRHAWVQVVRGQLDVNDTRLKPSDGAAISDLSRLNFSPVDGEVEFLLFELN